MVQPESSFDDDFTHAIQSNDEMELLCLLYKAHSIYGFSLLDNPLYKPMFNMDLLILSKIDEVKLMNKRIINGYTFDDEDYDYVAFFEGLSQYIKDNQHDEYYTKINELYGTFGNISDRQKYRLMYCILYSNHLEYCVAHEEMEDSGDLMCFRQACKWKRSYLTAHVSYILDELEEELGTCENDVYANGFNLLRRFYSNCNLLNVKNMKDVWLRNNTVPRSLLKVRDVVFNSIRDKITNENGEIDNWYREAFDLEN